MKVSNVSLISLSLLLTFPGALPMETGTNKALKKAQKVGKIALKIGAGTATLGIYAFMGTAALTSLGLTLGAAAALPFLYYARYVKPRLPISGALPVLVPVQAANVQTPESSKIEMSRPRVALSRRQAPKTRTSAVAKTAFKAAGILGALAVEDESLESANFQRTHMTREQAMQALKDSLEVIKAQLAECQDSKIQWNKQYNLARILEFPHFEGAYQDMIGIIDGDLQDVADAARDRMHASVAREWQQAGCKDKEDQLALNARKMQRASMSLPKL